MSLSSLIQAKIYAGNGIAAGVLGQPFDVYRPTSSTYPTAKLFSINAAFTIHSSGDYNFHKPSDYKGPLFHALVDGTLLQVGDYLNNPGNVFGPFFLISLNPLVPILAVSCNHIVSFYRRASDADVGSLSYGGNDPSTDQPLMLNWPVSLLKGSRGLREAELPGNVGFGMFDILAPYSLGVNLLIGDIIIDDLGLRYVIQSAELTDLGWRLLVQQGVV